MTDELQAAIDALYDAFRAHRRPDTLEVCSCCWPTAPGGGAMGKMVPVPAPGGARALREIGAPELAPVAEFVPLTSGSTAVLKHYLPRVLEIAVDDGFEWPTLDTVLAHLAVDDDDGGPGWIGWPDAEQSALRAFFHALFRDRLTAAPDDGDRIDMTVRAIGTTDPDIGWYLREWLRFEHPHAASHLEQFMSLNAGALVNGKLPEVGWSDRRPFASASEAAIVAWTRAESTRDAVAAAAERARTPEEATALAELYLRWMG